MNTFQHMNSMSVCQADALAETNFVTKIARSNLINLDAICFID